MDDVFEKKNIGVLGAGTWGYAVARHLSNAGHDVTLWSKLPKEILSIESSHGHPNLPGSSYPENIKLTLDLEEAVSGKDLLFFGTASPYIRSTAEEALPFISDGTLVVNLAKGIEDKTMLSMSDVLDEVINKDRVKKIPVGVLSGPTHVRGTHGSAKMANVQMEAYPPFFREHCKTCGSRMTCNGCSNCGNCDKE